MVNIKDLVAMNDTLEMMKTESGAVDGFELMLDTMKLKLGDELKNNRLAQMLANMIVDITGDDTVLWEYGFLGEDERFAKVSESEMEITHIDIRDHNVRDSHGILVTEVVANMGHDPIDPKVKRWLGKYEVSAPTGNTLCILHQDEAGVYQHIAPLSNINWSGISACV